MSLVTDSDNWSQTDSEGRYLAKRLADFVNALGKENRKDFVEQITSLTHRTLQQQIMELFLECCKSWAEHGDKKLYDARNEFTVKLAKEILQIDKLKGFTKLPLI